MLKKPNKQEENTKAGNEMQFCIHMSFFTNCQLNTMKPSTHSDIICVQNQYASLLRSFISCAAA